MIQKTSNWGGEQFEVRRSMVIVHQVTGNENIKIVLEHVFVKIDRLNQTEVKMILVPCYTNFTSRKNA